MFMDSRPAKTLSIQYTIHDKYNIIDNNYSTLFTCKSYNLIRVLNVYKFKYKIIMFTINSDDIVIVHDSINFVQLLTKTRYNLLTQ